MEKNKQYPVIGIEWIDSCDHSHGSWMQRDQLEFIEEHLLFETVGFLFAETAYSYIVIQSKGLHPEVQDRVDQVMEIPKCSVRRIIQYQEIEPEAPLGVVHERRFSDIAK